MSQCHCADFWSNPYKSWYPKRLLDLEALRKVNGLQELDDSRLLSVSGNLEHAKVRLVETKGLSKDLRQKEHHRYVTLSHCWGKPRSVQGQLKLTSKTEKRFINDGIRLGEFSKTFRDAILFACRLEHVGYIWIDSLCIKQPSMGQVVDQKDSETDWLEQSAVMHKVYQQSYLNISATAAIDGDRGLFFDRRPEYLWEDEINVNYSGTNSFSSLRSGRQADQLTRCTLIDLSFWDELVERAPVNRRAWVLQERLMAPRVLHFCHNQIAWECAEFHAAEGHPEVDFTLKAKLGDIVDEGRLKSMNRKDGMALREIRLKGYSDPDHNMEDLWVYELWKRVVEVYSRTNLTVSRDKLIALSGIARNFSKTTRCDYVAGLWRNYLESQLLWQVNENYRDGVFENPSRRDSTRAPSFSWSSIDSPHGITYADATDYAEDPSRELLFKVEYHKLVPADEKNPFGMIKDGYLTVLARYLRPIVLRRLEPPFRVPLSWHLKDDKHEQPLEHYNLYLDAPDSDSHIFKNSANLYCMPAAFGERTVRKLSRYLICLLLELVDTDVPPGDETEKLRTFRRIGITKLSNYADEKGQKAVRDIEANELIYLV
jgi:hypothetical protein